MGVAEESFHCQALHFGKIQRFQLESKGSIARIVDGITCDIPFENPAPGLGWPPRATGSADNPVPPLNRNKPSRDSDIPAIKAKSPRLFRAHGANLFVNDPPPGAGSPRVAIFSNVRLSHRRSFVVSAVLAGPL